MFPALRCCSYNCVVVSAVGDPLTHESQWRSITEAFLRDFPKAYFYHASDKYAALLQDMGYWINDVGAETTLQVRRRAAGLRGAVAAGVGWLGSQGWGCTDVRRWDLICLPGWHAAATRSGVHSLTLFGVLALSCCTRAGAELDVQQQNAHRACCRACRARGGRARAGAAAV